MSVPAATGLKRLHLDKTLFYALLVLAGLSLMVIYSATGKNLNATGAHFLRIVLGFIVLLIAAQIPPQTLERWAPYIFAVGIALLLAVAFKGVVGKGAQRWLSLGFIRFQPSEIMKLAVPMMAAWYLSRANLPPTWWRLALAALVVLVPVVIIARQPDLGTAVLVAAGGFFVLFLAGMYWRVLAALAVAVAAAIPFAWQFLHDYQRKRVLTLIDPQADPLGSGYHTIQSMIAVGSGGFYGKGWLNSTQAHLEFLPESHTDFIFAVFAEEFGLIGSLLLLGVYLVIAARTLLIAYMAQDTFTRLLAGSLALTFFINFFVNMGMVTGIMPVVGIPLPIFSYGGTAVLTLMASFGVLMSIHTHRKIAEM
ncbi:MAG: rod shape-determining protein RodA [Pseudomonadota bacterium]|nr:MAG: rod shape-determining protein RodA [Pseudomonadota bacterium]